MAKKTPMKPVAIALGAIFAGSMASTVAADANPFGLKDLSSGYMQLAAAHAPKDNEGRCGGDKKAEDGKCGAGKCGGDKKSDCKGGSCGAGKCGGDKKTEEGKCGAGKCGGNK